MADASGTSSGMSRGWRIALIASLALNLLVAGLVAGALLRAMMNVPGGGHRWDHRSVSRPANPRTRGSPRHGA